MDADTSLSPTVGHAAKGMTKPPAQFFIPAAASLYERRPRTLKHGDTFAVFDHSGDVISGPGSPEGLFHRDTRHLSHLYLTMNGGQRPILLSSAVRDDNAILTCDLTNPDLFDAEGRRVLGNDLIHIRRSRFLWKGSAFERLAVTNYDDIPRSISLQLEFACDFADLFEVRGTRRERRGSDRPALVGEDSVVLSYEGLDRQLRQTTLRFDPRPQVLSDCEASFRLDLAPKENRTVLIQVACTSIETGSDLGTVFVQAFRDARRALRSSSSRAASITSSNEIFNKSLRRCVADLYMLATDTPHGPYPYAGIPWFSTVFGRDALITALETLWLDPEIARGVLSYLAAHQAQDFDPPADAEPGKILHEVRQGEMALLGEVPFRRYYGSIDSTPLFVMLAGAYLERTCDIALIEKIWPNLQAALDWIDRHGDRDGDGYVEYGRRTAEGLANQGWKDSHDSVFHADGSIAKGPIALVEVQAYVYAAWMAGAAMLTRLGDPARAIELRAKAEELRERFDRDFFDEEIGTYVLALDGDKRPCRVRSSNAGHALFTGLALPERAETTVRTLMTSDSFSGWGVRTVATTEARYNPMSYHNGSIWPHDNALIAAGMARYGFRREAAMIFEGLFAASTYVDLRRLPELFCGFRRLPAQGPTFYPVSCIPQAWSASTPLMLVQTCLGLTIDASQGHILFNEPTLPPFLDEILLRNIRVGHSSADIMLRRSGNKVLVDVLDRRGSAKVLTAV